MLKLKNMGCMLAAGPFTHPVTVELVDTNEYNGRVGDVIRVEPNAVAEIERVLVAIKTERDELVESGFGRWDPEAGVWTFRANKAFPDENQGARIIVTAVARPGHNTTMVEVHTFRDKLLTTWRCAGEVHSIRYELRPIGKKQAKVCAPKPRLAKGSQSPVPHSSKRGARVR